MADYSARPVLATGIGSVGGFIGGLLGGGSGVFYVPALEKFTPLPRPSLHGTAGAANIAVTGVGAATFAALGGSIDLRAGVGLVVGATIGAFFGAKLVLLISERMLRGIFVGILVLTAIKLLLDVIGRDPFEGSAVLSQSLIDNLWFTVPVSVVLGVAIGAWAAGMGLGGGLLAVPVLMLLFGTDLPTAAGTSLLMFFPNAVVGTLAHWRQGTADIRLGALLNLGALPGAAIGAWMALAVDAKMLSSVFATFAFAVALREMRRMRGSSGETTPPAVDDHIGADERLQD